jgi:REP element-mobilizing transposase RayT
MRSVEPCKGSQNGGLPRWAQSLARLWTHLIFSTKERYPFLSEPNVRADMHGYLATLLRTHDCPTLVVGGCADHVHALFSLSRNYSISSIVKEVKRTSSSWIKTVERRYSKFRWQAGYGAFSVSQSHVAQVRNYISRQEQHHRRKTFQDEFRAFLKKYQIEYDERYVWD